MLTRTLESSLDSKENKPINPKGNQLWIFIGRTNAEAETPILWPPDAKSRLIGKDPDAGKDWGQEEKGVTEDEMIGWHQQLNAYEFEQTLGNSGGQGGLVYCSPWGHKKLDTTKGLNNNWYNTIFLAFTLSHLVLTIPMQFRENKCYSAEFRVEKTDAQKDWGTGSSSHYC